ncbi:class I SAM-dependent methyltransferase [Hydrogenimonas thermophila]|uniref:Ubiquinone biosynthesis O-methyltransferase n=1 Tax=Hydrogenimonas thermophila TaxID=223786 RepID=A0A1I5LAF0_9BACT|nr:class I SAM-dependent methyltransferase [Hydrogenimonas thermophila]SFO93701.1 ubiquinone biosynthesis O-methyltransferase [Hydrogenimonas thermophila]
MGIKINKEFQKYKTRGAYHWEQIGIHPIKRNSFVIARYKNMLRLAKSECGNLNKKKVLDIGCGDGVLSYFFAKEGAIVFGIDYSDIAIEFAKEKTKSFHIDFRQGSAYELPFEDNSFDIVISSDVIEHLEDVPKYLSEINRVVKNNGIVVISTPIKYTEYPLDKEHIIEWFQDEYKKVIEQKFKNTKYYYSHPLALEEIYQAKYFNKQWARVIMNIISFVYNPFYGFNSRFKYLMLQYSVSKVSK